MNTIPHIQHSLRIAILVNGFPKLSETFISLQIAELAQINHQVTVLVLGKRGDPTWLPETFITYQNNITIRYLKKRKSSPSLMKKLKRLFSYSPLFVAKLLKHKWFNNDEISFQFIYENVDLIRYLCEQDIIHCQFATLAGQIANLKKLGLIDSHAKLVCSVRGFDISKKAALDRICWDLLFRYIDAFLPVCQHFKSKLEALGCTKQIDVVYSPINANLVEKTPRHNPSNTSITIISVGRLVEKKGFLTALRACTLLKDAEIDFNYTIIGKGDQQEILERFVAEHGLGDRVTLMGALPPNQTIAIMRSADVFLAPSQTAQDGDSEGIPNVLKEAMLAGLQVVGTRHSGIPELIQDGSNGYLCDENNADDLAETIIAVVNNKPNWPAIASAAVHTITSSYTPQATTRKLNAIYISLANTVRNNRA